MSRIGKTPITLPAGVTVTIDGTTSICKGPKGEHRQHIPKGMTFSTEDGILTISRSEDSKTDRARHGLIRALIANQVLGVTEGFTKKLEIIGVGYRAAVKGKILDLQLKDNTKARILDSEHNNLPKPAGEGGKIRAQIETYNYLKT